MNKLEYRESYYTKFILKPPRNIMEAIEKFTLE